MILTPRGAHGSLRVRATRMATARTENDFEVEWQWLTAVTPEDVDRALRTDFNLTVRYAARLLEESSVGNQNWRYESNLVHR